MRDSDKYTAQAESVLRMADRAASPAERQVYETIARGWRKLAAEARRNERREAESQAARPKDPFSAANSR